MSSSRRNRRGRAVSPSSSAAAALARTARYGDGWHAIALSPSAIRKTRAEPTRLAPERHLDISLRISTTVDPGQRQDDPDATTLTRSPNAIADRIHQYRADGVDEFVLDFTASDESAHVEHLHRFADTVLPLLTETR